VRIRSLTTLAAVALVAAALTGCSANSTPSPTASADLCSAAAPSGSASDSVKVAGDAGKPATATFTSPLETSSIERTVVSDGTGAEVKAGDFVSYAFTAYYSDNGQQAGSLGYTAGELLPQQLSPESTLGQFIGCVKVGARLVITNPSTESAPGAVYVLDVLGVTPTAAWGTAQTPTAGFPTVTLSSTGEPSITIPSGATAPTTTEVETLKKGDGTTVAEGDQVLLQYKGVKWSDGSTFDASWGKNGPTTLGTSGVIAGFSKALVGQTVGSQVLVVIPPADGYGEKSESNTSALAGETLVFVIDILATQHTSTN
jgi:FKBP-type peptidyl-prolyl cis-trans isomerase